MQLAAGAVGATFLLIGILGFVPGVTQHIGDLKVAGHDSAAELLGLFEVSVLHNVVHLLFGVAGLAAAKAVGSSKIFLVGGGAIYLVLWAYGMVIDKDSGANFVPVHDGALLIHDDGPT